MEAGANAWAPASVRPTRSDPCRAAVGTRIVRAFKRTVRVEDHSPGVPHHVGMGVRKDLDVMACPLEGLQHAF